MSGSLQHKSEFTEGPIIGSTLGYKVYTALLTQSGTSAPTAVVLTNTLGGTVVWTRSNTNYFLGTLAGAFPLNKTWCSITAASDDFSAYTVAIGSVYPGNTNAVQATFLEGVGLTNGIQVEIRVYP